MNLPAHLADLCRAVPRSRAKATSIPALARLLDRDQRTIREQIKELREDYHIPVMAIPTRNGVWITDDPLELEVLIALQTSRARSIERSVRVLQQVADNLSYSPSLFS